MKRLQLLSLSALFALGASTAIAQDATLVNTTEVVSIQEEIIFKPHTDKKPKFTKWQRYYEIDKIEYQEDATIVTFSYEGHYSWLTFYGPEGDKAWQLIDDATGDVYASTAVKNVKAGRHLIAKEVVDDYGSFADDGHDYTCEIHFPRLPETVKQVDLIEGGEAYREYSNHFNVYDIQIHNPKIKRKKIRTVEVIEVPVEQEVVVEEAVENNTTENKLTLATEQAPTFNIYPNPTTTIINVEQFETQEALLEILDLQGKTIQTLSTQERVTSIDVSAFPAGSYIVRITTGDTQNALPFIIE